MLNDLGNRNRNSDSFAAHRVHHARLFIVQPNATGHPPERIGHYCLGRRKNTGVGYDNTYAPEINAVLAYARPEYVLTRPNPDGAPVREHLHPGDPRVRQILAASGDMRRTSVRLSDGSTLQAVYRAFLLVDMTSGGGNGDNYEDAYYVVLGWGRQRLEECFVTLEEKGAAADYLMKLGVDKPERSGFYLPVFYADGSVSLREHEGHAQLFQRADSFRRNVSALTWEPQRASVSTPSLPRARPRSHAPATPTAGPDRPSAPVPTAEPPETNTPLPRSDRVSATQTPTPTASPSVPQPTTTPAMPSAGVRSTVEPAADASLKTDAAAALGAIGMSLPSALGQRYGQHTVPVETQFLRRVFATGIATQAEAFSRAKHLHSKGGLTNDELGEKREALFSAVVNGAARSGLPDRVCQEWLAWFDDMPSTPPS